MSKKCEICGEEVQEKFRFCKSCIDSLPSLKNFRESIDIDKYYDEFNKLKKEIFQYIPERLAEVFKSGKPPLSYGMLRKFFEMIQRAWEKIDDFAQAKIELEKAKRFAEYQKNRSVIPAGFAGFFKRHIHLILNSSSQQIKDNLRGFLELMTSIVAYSVRKERRG